MGAEEERGIDLATAVEERGRRSRLEVTVIATVVAQHLHVLHADGTADGRLAPSRVVLSRSGPSVVGTSPIARAAQADDVRAWAAVVWWAAVGQRLPKRPDPEALDGLDLSVADLVVRAADPDPEERPSAEAILKVLLGGRVPKDASGAVRALVARTWELEHEVRQLIRDRMAEEPGPPMAPEPPAPKPAAAERVAAAARATGRGLVTAAIVLVVVAIFVLLAFRFAIR